MEMMRLKQIAAKPSSSVAGRRVKIASLTGCRVRSDRPMSPCRKRPSQLTYWIGIGRSRPYSWRRLAIVVGSGSSPRSVRIGSPGVSRRSVKIMMLTRSATGTISMSRRMMYAVIAAPSGQWAAGSEQRHNEQQ